MTQDEQSPGGLLSKVVKFVRNPTVHWSDLDQHDDKESQYSKQMLKEMIERKRANDFVRKREFDQLRKLRQRSAMGLVGAVEGAGRPSFLESSMPSDVEVNRAGTLKKIDEIEAQMSQQWWKGKDQGQPAPQPAQAPVAVPRAPEPVREVELEGESDSALHARQYAPTIQASLLEGAPTRDTDFPATDISPLTHVPGAPASADMLAPVDAELELDWPAAPGSRRDAEPEFVHDPVLDEAAIRLANGDEEGAESALTSVLERALEPSQEQAVRLALLDLYQATGQQQQFDAMAIAFASRCGRVAPAWSASPVLAGAAVAPAAVTSWVSPSVLTATAVHSLPSSSDLRLDWTALTAIADDALAPLLACCAAWAGQDIQLQLSAGDRLDGLLRRHTVSGDRGAPEVWWLLRMAWLRITDRADEFDLVALDYCITYEVSPPSWEAARCTVGIPQAAAPLEGGSASAGLQAPGVAGALSGVVSGDVSEMLAEFTLPADLAAPVLIDCAQLVRMDFAAAGSVLNWTVGQQNAGRQVQFTGLHRLLAVFFLVIGVGEHARIVPRAY